MSLQPLLQVEAALLRRQLPDLLLRPGMSLAARVAERSGSRGILMLAGSPLVAELPDGVAAGDSLKLIVQQARADKVVLKLVSEQPLAAPPHTTVPLPLPGGMQAQVRVDEREAGGRSADGEHAAIALSYDSPELGTLGLRLELAPGRLTVAAEVPAGRAHALADDAAGALRGRIEQVTGRAVEVRVMPRHEPLDVYA